MSLRTRSARLVPFGSLVLVLAATTTSWGASLPESVEGAPSGVPAPSPTTPVPVAPVTLPSMAPVRFTWRGGPFAVAGPLTGRETLSFGPVFRADDGVDFRTGGFSTRLLSRMNLEALRYRETNVSGATGSLRHDSASDLDSIDEANRCSTAARVITRSSHRALSDELEHVGRTSLGLGALLDRLQNISFRRTRPDVSADPSRPAQQDGSAAAAAPAPDRLRGDVGLRLDAHPALMFRARWGSLRGRVDVPVLNEPIRLSLESPVGLRGRAVLSSGLPRDGQAWATLTFSFGF